MVHQSVGVRVVRMGVDGGNLWKYSFRNRGGLAPNRVGGLNAWIGRRGRGLTRGGSGYVARSRRSEN